MKLTIITLILLCFGTSTFGQKQRNVWYFGMKQGLDFNTIPPTLLVNGQMRAYEGCASIADSSGNLLFYTNGGPLTDFGYSGGIWNKNHQMMPNGVLADTSGCTSAANSCVIIPDPGNEDEYYVFTVNCIENNLIDGVRYSKVNMLLDGGLGDVSIRDIQVLPNAVETIGGIKHANLCDYWVIVHENNTSTFHSILVSETGVNDMVTSTVGNLVANAYTQFISSPDGSKIAIGNYLTGLTIFDFNTNTGLISNPLSLVTQNVGCAFSPNGRYVYCNERIDPYPVYQFDLLASDVLASKINLGPGLEWNNLGQMQNGPDGKIYISQPNKHSLGVIENPNLAGIASSYVPDGLYVSYQYNSYGLPNFVNDYTLCSQAGLTETENEMLPSFFPNPFQNTINFQNLPEDSFIQLFTLDGKLIPFNIDSQQITFDQNLAKGIYIIHLICNGKTHQYRVVKE